MHSINLITHAEHLRKALQKLKTQWKCFWGHVKVMDTSLFLCSPLVLVTLLVLVTPAQEVRHDLRKKELKCK